MRTNGLSNMDVGLPNEAEMEVIEAQPTEEKDNVRRSSRVRRPVWKLQAI